MENYDNELVACMKNLKGTREELRVQISKDEEERARVESELEMLNGRLARLADSIATKKKAIVEFDKTIAETESAYAKILESAQTLVQVLKRESNSLERAAAGGTQPMTRGAQRATPPPRPAYEYS